jgi:leucyl aminopeptidase
MNVFVDSSFDPIPSLKNQAKVSVEDTVAESGTLGQFVSADGELPNGVDLSREALAAVNFTGKKGQTQSVPGDRPRVFIGTGKGLTSTAAVRDAVAAFARAAKDSAQLVVDLRDVTTNDVKARELGSAAAEGALLARYRWDALKNKPETVALEHLTIVVNENEVAEVTEGANHGSTLARSAAIARDLGNTPPRHLNADHYAQVVERLAGQFGLTTEVYDRAKIEELGLGGVLGVNAGSVQEPRVIKVMYRPSGANTLHRLCW